ncbi:GSCOCG00008556001-RA-CDS [Cotesia congregata]|nr:GSCOCG00008556001-RA-CDS [Cotesia congregata]
MSYCCIKSCWHKKKIFLYAEWVRLVGEEDFLFLNVEILHRTKYVCSCHFNDNDYSSNMKIYLKSSAVPSIFHTNHKSLIDADMTKFLSSEIVIPSSRKAVMMTRNITDNLIKAILSSVSIFNKDVKNRLHEKKICFYAKSLIASQFSNSGFNCPVHAQAINNQVSELVVTFLIRQECFFRNRRIEVAEMQSANASKIAELTGKGK